MSLEIRRLRPDDLPDFARCLELSLGFQQSPERTARFAELVAFEGSFVAVDGPQLVGSVGAFELGISPPGAEDLPMAGTTAVGVLPSHRRRGILTQLMKAHLQWARDRDMALAGLWASEPGIYPRFGFGLAAKRGVWSVDRKWASFDAAVEPHTLRFSRPPDETVKALYTTHRRRWAGTLTRSDTWWQHRRWPEAQVTAPGFGGAELVIAERDGQPRGYLQYRRKSCWEQSRPQDLVHVEELIGDPSARRALWRLLFEMDLVGRIESFDLPVDEGLHWLTGQTRGVGLYADDALWLAVLDVPRFVSARRYLGQGHASFGFFDAPEAWSLEVADGKAEVRPQIGEPELRLHRTDLPALVWGEASATLLFEAGRLHGAEESLHRADGLFRTERRPWCPERF